MRIEKVVIENLNSLMGRFEVDLTDSGYSGGLFAIVGPSGAGKTTVLDAICLALYGETPRISRVNAEQNELMSKGADSCRAEVVFVSRGRRYKASLAHRRNSKGAFRPVEREIVEYTAQGVQPVVSGITGANAKIVELTGLDYTRFTRSILLAQFRFAEFLKANANERAEILEQVTDMEIYRRISAAVFERSRREEDALTKIRMQSELIAVPDQAQETAYAQEKARLEAVLPRQTALRETLRQCGGALSRAAEQRAALAQYGAETPALQKALDEAGAQLQAAQQAAAAAQEALEVLRPTLTAVRALDIRVEGQKKECARLEAAIQDQDDAVREQKRRILAVFMNYVPDASKEQLKAMYETEDASALLRAGVQAEMDANAAQQQELRGEVSALLEDRDETQWRARADTLRAAVALTETVAALGKAKQDGAEEQLAQAARTEQLRKTKAEADIAAQRYEYALLEQRFGDERRKLTEGQPCPLCGATQHPFAERGDGKDFLSEAEALRAQADAALRRVERELAQGAQRLADAQKRIREMENDVAQRMEALGGEMPSGTQEALHAALQDADRRIAAYPALLKRQGMAADEAAKIAARLSAVERDVQAVAGYKQRIAEAQAQMEKRKCEHAAAQTECDTLAAQRTALFGSKDADTEEAAAVKSVQDAQQKAEQRRTEKEQAANALGQNARDVERTKTALEKENSAAAASYAQAKTQIAELKAPEEADEVSETFARAGAALGETPEPGLISALADALDALLSDGTEKRALLTQRLKEAAQNRKALQELKTAERAQKQRYEKWAQLNLAIGSRDGSKFSRMVQGITFDALLRYANVSLGRMTDRYILVRETEGGAKPLEMAVIDTYQAGLKRPVSNLSGGESFVVSLALALGLSEMSSGRSRIDSLFIDEGFASLDEDFLEAALQTLSALSAREGKLVGVISHVEAMKESIGAQVVVTKRTGGRSTLSGPGVTAQEA